MVEAVNLAGVRSAQPVPASPRPPRAAHRPAAARAPRTTPGCTCGHASAPPTATRPRACEGGGPWRRIAPSCRPMTGRRPWMTRAHDRPELAAPAAAHAVHEATSSDHQAAFWDQQACSWDENPPNCTCDPNWPLFTPQTSRRRARWLGRRPCSCHRLQESSAARARATGCLGRGSRKVSWFRGTA